MQVFLAYQIWRFSRILTLMSYHYHEVEFSSSFFSLPLPELATVVKK